jgi:hypothetical protein
MGDTKQRLELGQKHELRVNREGKLVLHHNRYGYPLNREIDPEALKDWLEEVTKPRFYIKTTYAEFAVHDREMGNEIVARFYNFTKGFDAKAEAERLCKQLNEGSDR